MPLIQQAVLAPSDPSPSPSFGRAVAVSSDTALVGAAQSAYVFTRSGTTWSQQAKLTPSTALYSFGSAVSLSQSTALVGTTEPANNTGSASVFVRSGTTWQSQQDLTPSDGAPGDVFGWAVAVDVDTALVAAPGKAGSAGAAYVFTRSGATWTQQAKLTASDAASSDFFGSGIALSGGTALVGASSKQAAYVFVRSGTTWTQQAKLTGGKYFAASVALSGDTAVLGEPSDVGVGVGGVASPGSAPVFVRSGTTWNLKISLSGGNVGDYFGRTVAFDGDLAVAGAPGDGLNFGTLDVGSAYAFRYSGGASQDLARIDEGSHGAVGNGFPSALAVSGATVLVGVSRSASNAGAAYAFVVGNGSPCGTATDCPSGFCVDGVCCDTACGGGNTDCVACWDGAGAAKSGVCGPVMAGRVCGPATSVCNVAGQCDGTSFVCPASTLAKDGTACDGGTCKAGTCESTSSPSDGGSAAKDAASSSDAGSGAPAESGADAAPDNDAAPPQGGGCGCRAAPRGRDTSALLVALAFGILLARRRCA